MKALLKNLRASISFLSLAATVAMAADIHIGTEWKIDTVDSSGPGRFTSLKIDSQGNVHAAYVTESGGHPLRYAFWDHALKKWFTMPVAEGASFSTLVLDSKEYPHISYADFGTGLGARLKHAYWNGQSWKVTPIDIQTGAVVAYYTSLALDANDNPVFSYYDYADPSNTFRLRLRSVFWMGSFWQAITADPTGGSGKFNSIALDSAGHAHIAYCNVKYETSSLRYASWDGKAWKTEILDGAGGPTPVYAVALVIDKNDTPHITYTDVGRRQLKYATRVAGKWQIQVLDSIFGPGYPDRNGIALDSQGNPYISYYDEKLGILKVAFRLNGRWMLQNVDRGFAGFTSSVGVDHDTLWISYADDNERSFKVAHRALEETTVVPVPPPPPPAPKSGK